MQNAYWEPEGFHQLGAGEYTGITAVDVYSRFKVATCTTNERDLAEWLEARQSWISDAKRRQIVPVRWLQLLILKQSEYTPQWVLTGQSEKLWSVYKLNGPILMH